MERGAALCLEQEDAKAGKLFQEVVRLIRSDSEREAMSGNVLKLHAKDAAHTIALRMVENVAVRANNPRAAALAAR